MLFLERGGADQLISQLVLPCADRPKHAPGAQSEMLNVSRIPFDTFKLLALISIPVRFHWLLAQRKRAQDG